MTDATTAQGPDGTDPFAAYHRAGRRMTLARVIPSVLVSLALVTGIGYAAATATPPAAAPAADLAAPAAAPAPPPDTAAEAPPIAEETLLPQPKAAPEQQSAPPPSSELAVTGAWTIDVDTIGYQAEIDACLWVRMDLGAAAPVVGAHNYCGGGIVLDMLVGDTVTLTGTGLDGTYSVTESRDARAGDRADTATAGLTADVILQTCYWNANGRERLLALILLPA